MRKYIILLLLIFSNQIFAQTIVKGIVKDATTKEPLAFASVQEENNKAGVTTDIDGKFSIKIINESKGLKVTYLGYKTKTIAIDKNYLIIELVKNSKQLEDVIIDGKFNPAHRIIDSFLNNKKGNNPFNNKTFKYNSYTKAGIVGDDYMWKMDAEETRKDSILLAKQIKEGKFKFDSTKVIKRTEKERIKDSIENINDSLLEKGMRENYFFFTESYSQRFYKSPNRNKETVIATKMSGFDNPNFAVTSNTFQPMGMYEDFISMIGKSYQSPLTRGCKKDYRFSLKDIIINNNDTTFIISYKPKKGKNFLGLKGFIHINSNNWALQNIIAQPAKDSATLSTFKLQQKFELVNSKWFPKQLNTIINYKDIESDSSVLHWDSKSYFSNIEINTNIANNTFDDVVLDYAENAGTVKDTAWEKLRTDTLTKKDKGTYETYKLLPAEAKKAFNTIPKVLEAIAVGAIPWGKFEVPIKDILKINMYEGIRLGFGLRTTNSFSKHIVFAGNIGYGFRDKAFKYGASTQFNLSKKRSTKFIISYKQDLEEPGMNTYFKGNSNFLATKSFRNFLVNRMDSVQELKALFSGKPFHNLQVDAWMSKQLRNEGNSNYAFKLDNQTNYQQAFINTEIGVGLKYTIGETYTMIGRAKILKTPPSTQIIVHATKGLPNVLDGDLDYKKIAFQINHTYKTRKFGETNFQLYGGQVFGNVPYSFLFNALSAKSEGERKYPLYSRNHFQTASLYEFVNDRMLQFTWEQNFGKLFFETKSKWFKPEFIFSNTLAYGWLQNPSLYQNTKINTLQDGLFESGIIVNNIYTKLKQNLYYQGLGFGVFYRYGANSNANTLDNFALRITTTISF